MQALCALMILLGLITLGAAALGLHALVRRRWGRGTALGLLAAAGGVACGALPVVLASAVASGSADAAQEAQLLAETLATLLNCAAAGLLALPLGGIVALVGLAFGLASRR
ncbi:hypothetical protein BE17_16465 [Sorangium cellulosum]|uniref:Uncharacterized protein n=1 Tax=Sorangium cellulosum TaxID=56 RepID=A0A150R0A8_SORCE|nr:hypothetical protein BE17_16465 [Sorangium cellulosum]